MRILKIRFKNLNSLAGDWKIDLTRTDFASDGIFAITGPTGAGKTTILDAVCLALYARTPRLGKITKSGNEIMSRRTGECFAEVTFESQAGRFRCHWSQHRARKKPDGVLQAPRHEVADADSGRIFGENIKSVAEQIEMATGMDFERFTRSMLLAQGGFAAFLQASPDERAPILEQITGTGIYSRISVRVHERRSDERKKLETLQAELAGMELLGEEDESRLRASLEGKAAEETVLSGRIESGKRAIDWLNRIELIGKDLAKLEDSKKNLDIRLEEFLPEREKLERAGRALELSGESAALGALRGEQNKDLRSMEGYRKALPAKEIMADEAGKALKLAVENHERKKIEKRNGMDVIRKARELDLTLREKEPTIKSAGRSITDKTAALDSLVANHEKERRLLEKENAAFEDIERNLTETRKDEGLVEQLTGIRDRIDALRELEKLRHFKASELKKAESLKKETVIQWEELVSALEIRTNELGAAEAALEEHRGDLEKILGGREIGEWRNSLTELGGRKRLLEKAGESVEAMAASNRVMAALDIRGKKLTLEKTDLAARIEEQAEKHTASEKKMLRLQARLSRIIKIHGFDEARRGLRDGEQCPLCGAEEHPFAEGNIPVKDEAAETLERAAAEEKKTNKALSGFRIRQAATLKELEQVEAGKKEAGEKIEGENARIRGLFETLGLDAGPDGDERMQVLFRMQKENSDNLDETAKGVKAADRCEAEITRSRDGVEKAKEAAARLERKVQGAAHARDSAEQSAGRAVKELDDLAAGRRKAEGEILGRVSRYGFESLAPDTLDGVLSGLTSRRDIWVGRQKEKAGLEKRIAALELRVKHQSLEIGKSEAELKAQRKHLDVLTAVRDDLARERTDLFGDKRPDDEEARLAEAVEEGEKKREDARRKFENENLALADLVTRIEETDKEISSRSDQLKAAESDFLRRLGEFGFTGERDFLSARLPEEKRKSLVQRSRKLEVERTELEAGRREKTAALDAEKEKRVTDKPLHDLEEELAAPGNSLKELQQEVGGIRQKLSDNDRLRRRQKERAREIDAQKHETFRWDRLHELIGSADGKKYRNFAQGLTFELMTGYANRQLRKMTDRYLLIRDENTPLNLNVIDNYQAGEIRSTKNLSGGESFIVSLALALGLSSMAGRNVRVDSLFLDEGFGTLDEDALDTALETLAGLRGDNKLIGVISHVSALKDRISTRISVEPVSGGRSRISGPGCGPAD